MPRRGRAGTGLAGPAMPEPELALAAIYTAHGAAVLGFVRRYVDDPQHAEDVVQETFLRTWRNVEHIDNSRNPRSYLFTVARNVLTDRWRQSQRRPRLVTDEHALQAAPSPDAVDAALEGWLVADALTRLSAEHRAVVQALFFDGLSVTDAAATLEIAEGTVRSRSFYAVRALRVAFQEMGVTR